MSDPLAAATGADGVEVRLFDDRVEIARRRGTEAIPLSELTGVRLVEPGFLGAGALQLDQEGVDLPEGGLLKPPLGENTVRFPAVRTPEFRALHRQVREALDGREAR